MHLPSWMRTVVVIAATGRGVHDEIGVIHSLPQADEQVEDVRVVIKHRATGDVVAELRLTLRVECLVEISFAFVECILSEDHAPRWEGKVVCALQLRSTEEYSWEDLMLEDEHRCFSTALIALVLHTISAVFAGSLLRHACHPQTPKTIHFYAPNNIYTGSKYPDTHRLFCEYIFTDCTHTGEYD